MWAEAFAGFVIWSEAMGSKLTAAVTEKNEAPSPIRHRMSFVWCKKNVTRRKIKLLPPLFPHRLFACRVERVC